MMEVTRRDFFAILFAPFLEKLRKLLPKRKPVDVINPANWAQPAYEPLSFYMATGLDFACAAPGSQVIITGLSVPVGY